MKNIFIVGLIALSTSGIAGEYTFLNQKYKFNRSEKTIHTAFQNIKTGANTGSLEHINSEFNVTSGGSLFDMKELIIDRIKKERGDFLKVTAGAYRSFINELKIVPDEDDHNFEEFLRQEIKSPVFLINQQVQTCEEIALKTIKDHQISEISILIQPEDKKIYRDRVNSLLAKGYPCEVDRKKITLPSFVTAKNKINIVNSLLKIAQQYGQNNNLVFDILNIKTESTRQEKIKNYLALRAILLTQLGKLNPANSNREAFLMQVPQLVINPPTEETKAYLKPNIITYKEMAEVLGE
jgi:hypothetical protein